MCRFEYILAAGMEPLSTFVAFYSLFLVVNWFPTFHSLFLVVNRFLTHLARFTLTDGCLTPCLTGWWLSRFSMVKNCRVCHWLSCRFSCTNHLTNISANMLLCNQNGEKGCETQRSRPPRRALQSEMKPELDEAHPLATKSLL